MSDKEENTKKACVIVKQTPRADCKPEEIQKGETEFKFSTVSLIGSENAPANESANEAVEAAPSSDFSSESPSKKESMSFQPI